MARRLGRQIGDRRNNFSRQSFFLLAMATKTVAAWSAAKSLKKLKRIQKVYHSNQVSIIHKTFQSEWRELVDFPTGISGFSM